MISSVTTTLKGTSNRTFKLSPKTLIVGSSASGKSTITQAVELAVGKRMSDYLGRADSSLRTVQHKVSPLTLETAIEGTAGPLLYAEVLENILKNPLDAHLGLLKATLDESTLATLSELKTLEREKKELMGKASEATAARDAIARSEQNEPEGLPTRALLGGMRENMAKEAEGFTFEANQMAPKIEALKSMLKLWVAGAWGPERLLAISQYIPTALGQLVVDTDSFGLGLQRHKQLARWSPSGSEWNIIVTALACWDAEWREEPLPVIIPADRAIDQGLLESWMRCLSKSRAQVLLTTVAAPTKVPPGWEVLHVDGTGKPNKVAKRKAPRKVRAANPRQRR